MVFLDHIFQNCVVVEPAIPCLAYGRAVSMETQTYISDFKVDTYQWVASLWDQSLPMCQDHTPQVCLQTPDPSDGCTGSDK